MMALATLILIEVQSCFVPQVDEMNPTGHAPAIDTCYDHGFNPSVAVDTDAPEVME